MGATALKAEIRRPASLEPYLRGCAFPAGAGVSYPRADPVDAGRLPADTWHAAKLPIGVRLELVGDASAVDLEYVTATDEFGARGSGGGTGFAVYRDGTKVDEQPAVLGAGNVRLTLGSGSDRAIVYLPEWMRPTLTGLAAVDGEIAPAPEQPRWLCYGDSIVEGWVVSQPALAWPAIAGRAQSLDVVNFGYDASARGEIVTAEHLASTAAAVISLHHGTNCWTRIPHTADMVRAGLTAFLAILRSGHPGVPIVVSSPIVRPEADVTQNKLGATLADLRVAMEEATVAFGDPLVTLLAGESLIDASLLADGIHPGDEGHAVLAATIGAVVRRAFDAPERAQEPERT